MNKFKTFTYKSKDESKLTSNLIIDSINKFWKEHMKNLSSDIDIQIIYRIVFYKDNKKVTLFRKYCFNSEEIKLFQGLTLNLFEYSNNINIKNNSVNKIIIKFKELDNQKEKKLNLKFILSNYRIPMTMDIKDWGNILHTDNNLSIIKKRNSNLHFKIIKLDNLSNNIVLNDSNDKTLLKFIDIRREGDSINTFVRIYQEHIYFIYNGNRFFKLNKRIKI